MARSRRHQRGDRTDRISIRQLGKSEGQAAPELIVDGNKSRLAGCRPRLIIWKRNLWRIAQVIQDERSALDDGAARLNGAKLLSSDKALGPAYPNEKTLVAAQGPV